MSTEHRKKHHPIVSATSGIGLAMQLIGGLWKVEILWQLHAGALRFGVLKKRVPPISDRMLSQSLRELEKAGLVHREIFAEVPPRVMYSLTEDGLVLLPILQELNSWGLQRMATKAEHTIDPGVEMDDHIAWS